MKVLITGAFGNLGLMCIQQALELGYEVTCFDLASPKNAKLAQQHARVKSVLGDIQNTALLSGLVADADAIIHNASVLPPVTDNHPELAEKINVQATKALIDLAEECRNKPVVVFPSSVTVFGHPEGNQSLKTARDAVQPTDNYTRHKVAIEEYLQASSIPWVVLRVGVSVDARTLATDRKTFSKLLNVNADNPMEYVHPKDVALAMCNAVSNQEAFGKVLLIGGGASCQVSQREFVQTAFNAMGLKLPLASHGQETFYTHWMDTNESQRLLQFQQHNFAAYVGEMEQKLKPLKYLFFPLRPLINLILPRVLRLL